ncbi:venom carboxylesterase-6-like [Ostrinia furnacalis]|uniref:venom carboxylesterase-6-like n=1 Tax=Ostrinia furnacalis TaxID=93504 RepID=UPI00103BADBA|nr:venom carboxylesterase-6-like [Ostrinia furnacalis]
MRARKMFILLFACLTVTLAKVSDERKFVNLKQGPVLGFMDQDVEVFGFYGIPYATAPTGRDRFKAPLPPPIWNNTFKAIDQETICPQYGQENYKGKKVKEDCLIANVFVPNTETKNLPVMVSVHGGAFQIGYGNSKTPKQLVSSKRIIAVTFNYRVGPHGFLCLGTEEAPGNAGMKDQVALLRWVKENIRDFGGNPDDVTIVGCSAGGASVDLLLLSKMANGLFNKAIAMSGANVGVFGAQVDPIENARNYTLKYARNYEGDDVESLVEFYVNVPLELLNSVNLLGTTDLAVVFSPCVEADIGIERFLHDTPVNIIKNGDYVRRPLLYGFANMEGLYRTRYFESWTVGMNDNYSDYLPADLGFRTEEEKQEAAERIKQFYFGDKLVDNKTSLEYVEYFTDAMFVYAMQRSVTLQVGAGNNDIYLFVYSFVDKDSEYVPYTDIQGATHCMEAHAAMDEDESEITPEYKMMKQTMRESLVGLHYNWKTITSRVIFASLAPLRRQQNSLHGLRKNDSFVRTF